MAEAKRGIYRTQNRALYIDNVRVSDIASQYGTPCYIYSASVIRGQYNALKSAMEKALPQERQPLLCFACKANSNLAVLSLLQKQGAGMEIVSEGELYRGLRAGFEPKKIVSTGVGKQKSEIKACLKAGIRQFNVESLPELELIQNIAISLGKSADVVFRYNPDIAGGGHDKISTGRKHDKFGLNREMIFKAFERANELDHVNACGLSMHIGSQVFTLDSFRKAFEKLAVLVGDLRQEGYEVSRLDIGGGFPIPYEGETNLDLDGYAAWVRDLILPLDTDIIMEPGRFLVGNAGILVSEVLYVKESHDRRFAVIDAAMNDLVRPAMYDAFHNIVPVDANDSQEMKYDIVGPVCETGDRFALDRKLPPLKQGDLLAIESAGAYGFTMASNYNSRPLPCEILVDGAKHFLIRPRQSYDDILGNDLIPNDL